MRIPAVPTLESLARGYLRLIHHRSPSRSGSRRGPPGAAPGTRPRVAPGRKVSIHFTLTLDDGRIVHSSFGGEPLHYVHGFGRLVPGLEQALAGCSAGDHLHVCVPPQAGFPRLELPLTRVPRSDLPADASIFPGLRFRWQIPDGSELPARVHEVTDRDVLVVFEHPLTGKRLHFDVEVVEVR